MSEKLDPEEVRKQRRVIEMALEHEQRQFMATKDRLDGMLRKLQGECPHENMNSGSYTRWCCDCGRDWDTT